MLEKENYIVCYKSMLYDKIIIMCFLCVNNLT